ncbi:MAG: FAD-dependent oxidoreductase [Bacillota bacterium]
MYRIGIIGGGIAGSTAALELKKAGFEIVIFEKENQIGGQIKEFGCKATDVCTRCNLCLVDSIFNQIKNDPEIEIKTGHQTVDAYRDQDGFTLYCETQNKDLEYSGFDKILLATGYKRWSELETGTPEIFDDPRIIWAGEMEEMLFSREDKLQHKSLEIGTEKKPESAYFIQCNGSRSPQEKARYCSRVCCGYNYRLARVLRDNFPEMELGIFFIDMQESGFLTDLSFQRLEEENIKYYNCKPLRINRDGDKLTVSYEDQSKGEMAKVKTDLLILSEGIHPGEDNLRWADLFNLQLDEDGFLEPIWPGEKSGVYLAGTVKNPGDIATTIADSRKTAYKIIEELKEVPV